ncbi:MAG: class I SAM-dependent methyltransferase [Flavobacteriales bacterium]|nr:class I SAM-dependent methyltransferase [Flavobacteriales bacterium]
MKEQETPQGKSYHDHVIKDGRFIGDFDGMYAAFEDPWMQSEQPNQFSRTAGIVHLRTRGMRSVLECGCGLGYYAQRIHRETGIVPISVDISSVAIAKAKKLFPHLRFEVADIAHDLRRYKEVDCLLFAELIWYILPQLDAINAVLSDVFKGKWLLVNQVFYKGSQQYGTEYFTSLQEFINYMPFEAVAQCEATSVEQTTIETSTLFRIA